MCSFATGNFPQVSTFLIETAAFFHHRNTPNLPALMCAHAAEDSTSSHCVRLLKLDIRNPSEMQQYLVIFSHQFSYLILLQLWPTMLGDKKRNAEENIPCSTFSWTRSFSFAKTPPSRSSHQSPLPVLYFFLNYVYLQ